MEVSSIYHYITSIQFNAILNPIGKTNLCVRINLWIITNKLVNAKILNENKVKRLMLGGHGTNSTNEFIIGIVNDLNLCSKMILKHSAIDVFNYY